jgi:hypothetical protein
MMSSFVLILILLFACGAVLGSGEIRFANYPKELFCDGGASAPFVLKWFIQDSRSFVAGEKLSATLRENVFDAGDVLANPLIYDYGIIDYPTSTLDLAVPREVGHRLAETRTIDALIAIVKVNKTSFNSSPKSCFASICVGFDKTFPFTCGPANQTFGSTSTPEPTVAGECRGKVGCKCLNGECPEFPPGLSCGFFDNMCKADKADGAELGRCRSDSTCDAPLQCKSGWCMKANCIWPAQTSNAECPCGLHSNRTLSCESGSSCSFFGGLCTPKSTPAPPTEAPDPLICNGEEVDVFTLKGAATMAALLACFDALEDKCGSEESKAKCECAELIFKCYEDNGCEVSKSFVALCRKEQCDKVCPAAASVVTLSIDAIAVSLIVALTLIWI